jgi:cell division protein FtsB
MPLPLFNRSNSEQEFAHKFADDIRRRLVTTTVLGLLTVLSTGISAAFGYYTRDLPRSITSLTTSVESLRTLLVEQQKTNDRQDDDSADLNKRVTRLEDRL